MRNFRKLIAWQKAHALAVAVHEAAKAMRPDTAPGLRSQLLRAASSISANLAEGCGKRTQSEFARYIDIAMGSTRELENHLMLAKDLRCVSSDVADRLLKDASEVGRILFALARAVRSRAETATTEASTQVKEASATEVR